jgi:hypothetical protein
MDFWLQLALLLHVDDTATSLLNGQVGAAG